MQVTVYKADQKTNVYYIIGFVILFGVTISFSSRFTSNNWTWLILFLLLFVLYNFLTLRLNEVWLNKTNNKMTLVYKNYLGAKKTLDYELVKIEFTYKQQATSFTGRIKNVCTIYYSDKEIARLIPDNDDWRDDEIKGIVRGLLDAGIKKKFIGYSVKDAET
jgi:Ca2+/Na+ antiporter